MNNEDMDPLRDKRFWALLFIVGLAFPAAWTITIVNSVGLENVLKGIGARDPSMVFAIGAFGSSFGFLAAIFAGLAVALLWKNLEVSQQELKQLQSQMEEDRNLSIFLKMLDLFQETREKLVDTGDNDARRRGKAVIEQYALEMQELRQRGDFDVDDPLRAMKEFYHDPLKPFPRNFDLSLSDYCQLTAQMIRFIASVDHSERLRFMVFLKALLSTCDYIVLHEYFLMNLDSDFEDVLINSGFFVQVGLPLCVMLQGGGFFPASVYGHQVVAAVSKGKLKV